MVELYYGISIPENSDYDKENVLLRKYYTDKSEVMKILKDIKGARFKVFRTPEDAEAYSLSCVPAVAETLSSPAILSSPKPSEKSEFKSLKPQEEVKFRKAIERSPSDLEFMSECVESNARYLVTPSDTPTILHQGPRHNALHVAARHGKLEAAQLVVQHVTGGLMSRMYPAECQVQNRRRREHLVDLYLNMPDKGGGDSPLHLASKWGHLELVKLLCGFHQTRLQQLNKNGETALTVVCSRAGDEKRKEEISAVLAGLLVIPVYRAEESKQLGRPISLREAADLLETSASEHDSFSSQDSGSVTSSPLVLSSRARVTPVSRSPLRSPMVRSPMVESPLVGSPNVMSPLVGSPLVSSITAVLGPVPASQADSLWRTWKASPARERLEDPSLGLERQGRQLAGKEGLAWLEFWPWLGEYLDLASPQGLELLENHLEEKIREARETLVRDNEDDIVDELEASLVLTRGSERDEIQDDLVSGNGELEIVSSMSSSSPVRGGSWTKYRTEYVGEDNSFVNVDPQSDSNANITLDQSDNEDTLAQPLSPLSSLMNGFDSLKLDNERTEDVNVSVSLDQRQSVTKPPANVQSSMSEEVRRYLQQFVTQVVGRLGESLPEGEVTEAELSDWLQPVRGRWEQLRRQVNNWRSDPRGRWVGLDWGQLGVNLVELMRDEVTLELGSGFEVERFAQMLGSVRSVVEMETESDDSDQDERYKRGRGGEVRKDPGLADMSKLCSLVSQSLLSPSLVPPVKECHQLWDLLTDKTSVSTVNVNRARRFLHSTSSESSRARRDSGQSVTSQTSQASQEEDWVTPPSSPEGSVASMQTCSEPALVWVVGGGPSTQDRRVGEALSVLQEEQIARYPSIALYLSQLGSYSREQQLSWKDPYNKPSSNNAFSGLARRLDMNITF